MGRIRSYQGDGVTITFDPARCIHAEECIRGLPAVFDADRRPWIDATLGDPDAIAEVVSRCPTGALHVRHPEAAGEPGEPGARYEPAASDRVRVTVVPKGPLYVRGHVHVVDDDGGTWVRDTRVALCRCGASKRKPFCDNSHVDIAFEE